MTDENIIANLLNLDVDDLYAEIGNELYGKAAFPPSHKRLVELARKWLDSKRSEIAVRICHAEIVVHLTSSEDPTIQNRILLVAAVADLIASLVKGVSPVTVSVLLIKEGLSDLCKDV